MLKRTLIKGANSSFMRNYYKYVYVVSNIREFSFDAEQYLRKEKFSERHIGPNEQAENDMLKILGYKVKFLFYSVYFIFVLRMLRYKL